ncbi:hypothetical protein ACWEN3_09620 [Streptomyces sp. NPDC004561]
MTERSSAQVTPGGGTPRRPPSPVHELSDVHQLLEEIRLRPGMWLPGGSTSRPPAARR